MIARPPWLYAPALNELVPRRKGDRWSGLSDIRFRCEFCGKDHETFVKLDGIKYPYDDDSYFREVYGDYTGIYTCSHCQKTIGCYYPDDPL